MRMALWSNGNGRISDSHWWRQDSVEAPQSSRIQLSLSPLTEQLVTVIWFGDGWEVLYQTHHATHWPCDHGHAAVADGPWWLRLAFWFLLVKPVAYCSSYELVIRYRPPLRRVIMRQHACNTQSKVTLHQNINVKWLEKHVSTMQ